jgi:hypothetical protein
MLKKHQNTPSHNIQADGTNPSHQSIAPFLTKLIWTRTDINAVISLGFGLIYLAVREPILSGIIFSLGLFFHCLNQVINLIPYLNHFVGIKIRFWHIAGLIRVRLFWQDEV